MDLTDAAVVQACYRRHREEEVRAPEHLPASVAEFWTVDSPPRDQALARDAADPLAPLRAEFALPEGVIYLDGNSLGALPRRTAARLSQTVAGEWGEGLIRSWNGAGWIDLAGRIGDRIARLIGAGPGRSRPATRPRSTCSRP